MPVELCVAPAGYGKTEYAVEEVLAAAQGLQDTPRVLLPAPLQIAAWQRRLADGGGALGVHLLTFDRLYARLLNGAGQSYTKLDDPVEYRLLRAVVDDLPLPHYGVLGSRPGFIQVVRAFIRELKGALIWPGDYLAAAGAEPRLRELGLIYERYQQQLRERGWADRPGLGWLALEAARARPQLAGDWSLLAVDGFDSFTEMQLAVLALLAGRVERMVITLTGEAGADAPRAAQRRFRETQRRLEARLEVTARPLPRQRPPAVPLLARVEAALFESGEQRSGLRDGDSEGETGAEEEAIELVAAPDRAGEVREALRWLKARVVEDGADPADLALLARDLAPYRPLIRQTAAEFGLPLWPADGLPLRQNPAVAALLALLRLLLPAGPGETEPALPRRQVVAAWRSPYFDWTGAHAPGAAKPVGIGPGDAEALDAAARWGQVLGGLAQWEALLERLAALAGPEGEGTDEERGRPAGVPVGDAATALNQTFTRFLERLQPLREAATYREHVRRLEALIGPDPREAAQEAAQGAAQGAGADAGGEEGARRHLDLIRCADAGGEETAGRDRAALQALKAVLRGLVWAEEVIGDGEAIPFPRFFEELAGAIEAASYLPPRPAQAGILVADAKSARGVPFQAVAVMGLAEGEFPAGLREDPFLRDADRRRLREEHGLRLESSTESRERETFYETATRPWARLLLTRPRLAESGAPWQPSPFWTEMARCSGAAEEAVSSERVPRPEAAASWPEMMAALVTHAEEGAAARWVAARAGERWQQLAQAATIFEHRYRARSPSPYDGDLSALAETFGAAYGPEHTWSASRLESYRTCPLFFFVGRVLGLEPRPEPAAGLDARQLGNLYHRILEEVYRAVPFAARTDAEALKEALPGVAEPILAEAPLVEGFRPTAWWEQTRAEMVENIAASLEALSELAGDFVPVGFEAGFFGRQALTVLREDGDAFRLHGLIDRVDRNPAGQVRIVDYKTAGPYKFTKRALEKGEKLQLPLYALAAEQALEVGEVADGFYWHVQHAEPSKLQLAEFGVAEALETATGYAWEVIEGVRAGDFGPSPPADGCPAYCPATAFCWQYEARTTW